jgi:DNA-binding MarR family transcriptional regulator
MGRSIPDPAVSAEIADLLYRVTHRMRRASEPVLEPLGLTWAQLRALRTLARSGPPLRMSELAERLRIARRSATSLVDELVERGLVERLPDPADRRAVTVAVTPAGGALLDRLVQRRREAAGDLTSALDGRELRVLRDLLRRLDSATSAG